jgi:CheY-like chemotaxis protein
MLDSGDTLMSPATAAKTLERGLVVLIEDDNRVAPALAMLVEDWGYECIAVRSPAVAAAQLGGRISEVIAIIADLSRDDAWFGRRSAEAINSAFGTKIPRIVTTNEPAEARAHGFTHVLAKPYDPEALLAWLQGQASRAGP